MAGPTMYKGGACYEFNEVEALRLADADKCVLLDGPPEPEAPTVKTAHIGPNQAPNKPRQKKRRRK